MKEIDALKTIFNKKADAIHVCRDKWAITEKDKGATFRKLEILCTNKEFHVIVILFTKGLKTLLKIEAHTYGIRIVTEFVP